MNEKELVASSYLYTFYMDVQELNASHSNFVNYIDYLNAKYSGALDKGIEEQDNLQLRNLVTKLRYFIHKCYMEFKTISSISSAEVDIDVQYKELRKAFIPPVEIVQDFVLGINKYILQDGIKQLLQTSASIVSQIFSSNDTEKPASPSN